MAQLLLVTGSLSVLVPDTAWADSDLLLDFLSASLDKAAPELGNQRVGRARNSHIHTLLCAHKQEREAL